MRIDLNADVGESFGRWTLGDDAGVIPHVTSANIACGYHAGDPAVMRAALRLARQAGVAAGAHPGFPDLAGFGRRALAVQPEEAHDFVLYQIGALAALASAERVTLRHVKPHGALYTMAAREYPLAAAIVRAVALFDPALWIVGPPGSELLRAAGELGLRGAAEGFADRAYEPDGSLASRHRPGAVIHDVDRVAARAVRMVRDGVVTTTDGTDLAINVDTICIHGDTPGAGALASRVREALAEAGCAVVPPGAPAP